MQNKSNRTFYQLAAAANQRVKEKDYWLSKLSGEYVKSYFPYDYHMRNVVQSHHRLEAAAFVLSPELSSALIKLSRGSDIRLYITLVTGLNALLYQYMAMDIDVLTIADIDTDIVVGMPILKSETEIDFINTLLVLRTPINPSMTFKELVLKTRQTIIEAIENRDYPIEILARDLNMPFTSKGDFPLLDVALLMENIHDRTYLNHVNLNMIFSFTRCESFIQGRLEYNPLLYRETTIEQIINHFKFLLREAVSNADILLCKVEMISEEEKKRLLVDFNDTAAEYPQDKSIHELFEQQAEKAPDVVAVVGGGWHPQPIKKRRAERVESVGAQGTVPVPMDHVSITYKELNEKSNRLAGFLRERGVEPDSVAAILVERSVEMIIGILGILKAGGAYLPIDPGYPQERIDYMLEESGVEILLTDNSSYPSCSSCSSWFTLAPEALLNLPEGRLIHHSSFITHHSGNLAYIIYTSGSTGRPKGVMVEHRSLTAYIYSFLREFDLGSGDTVLQQASSSFDAFVEEVYPVLLRGGRLVIPGKDTVTDIARLSEFILKNRVNIVDCSPLLLDRLNQPEYLINLNGIHTFISGGDVLKGEYIDNLLKIGTVYNTYGPTETTVCAAYFKCSQETQGNIPIGKPIANYNVYILDRFNRLLPVGVPGELCISGVGVARGYLNRPELTAEKFDNDLWDYQDYHDEKKKGRGNKNSVPSVSSVAKRIYKTGDLACWLPDGNIEFLGRIDQQVKLRGFRLELGEIENRLLEHKNVKEAFVVLREDRGGDNFLCAYVVTGSDVGKEELKKYLMHTLPGYMIPQYFVFIDKIPVTPGGKIDRKLLPAPVLEASERYAAPRNTIEEKLAVIWSTVLAGRGYESIGIDDNFFELGGHSLRAAALISKIHKELDVNVPLSEIFTSPTIRGLALYIKQAARDKYESVHPLEKKEYYPLSSAQKRLYFLQHMAPESTGYNMPLVLTLVKNIEVNKLESILKQLIARHESLRTSFVKVNDVPVQRVHSHVEFEIEYYDRKLPTDFVRPFDLSQAPLIRSGLIKTREGNHIWMVDMHHIISDGTSMVILQEDFVALYSGEVLSELNIQYKDFSGWQYRLSASGVIKSQEEYWLNLYRDAGEIPRLDLPLDYKRPQVFTFAGDHYNFMLEREDTEKFKSLAARNNGTLYMNILAVLNTLFYKYTAQSDITIGSGVAGRPHEDLQGIIGMFVNTLAMRSYPQGEKTYESFLREVIAESVKAFENQDMQFEELVEKLDPERDSSRNPLFDISMVVQNFRTVRQGVIDIEKESTPSIDFKFNTSKFDMTFFVHEVGEDVVINLEYYTGIFKRSTIRRLVSHLKRIVKTIIQSPYIQLKDIDILSEEERHQLLYFFNDTVVAYPGDKTIHELFEEQVERTPEKIALVGSWQGVALVHPVDKGAVDKGERTEKTVQLTYMELNKEANRLACYLIHGKNVLPGDRLGIWMSQSLYRPVSILGVLKAGAAYVPIDPSLPEERIKYMINDASIGVVISEKKFLKGLNCLQWECRGFHSYICVDSFDIHGEEEIEPNELMDKELWHHVGETASDDITGGGWISSYTGEPLSGKEMDEYGDNILKKLAPLLHPQMRVLEIGCASGISMYRLAPNVGLYYGTDLSAVIIDKNKKRVEEEGHRNIKLSCLAAHEIDKIKERNFDLVILNSVIQCFHGHNYLRKVIRQAVELVGDTGYLFIGDIMDQDKKAALVRELMVFNQDNKGKSYTTKTDFSSELFVSRGFWTDLAAEWKEIESVEFTEKIYTIENELTKFRYDTLMGINKKSPAAKKWVRLKLQDDFRNLAFYGSERLQRELPPDSLGYVIYTSGTTGRPKGVMIEHCSLVNLCYWHNRYHQISEADNTTLYAGFGFDASVLEIFPHLLRGAALHLVDDAIKLDIEALNAYYERNHISVSYLPTQFCEQFMNCENRSLRVLLTGGDKLRTFVKRSYYLFDNYGPTENTVVTTGYRVEKVLDNIPIGKPVDNNRVYILNREGWQPQPVGVAGELYISGVGLSRGYLNSPELTAEKFLSISNRSYRFYRSYISKKIYKTGDLARWLWDGNIEFLGRIDYQVKIRGYRIELGDIKSQLLASEGIKEAVVMVWEEKNGQKYLCAYIVSNQGQVIDISELRIEVSAHLPDYMVPAYLMQLDGIPLTPNGKVDRRKLPKPGITASERYAAPRDELERKLVVIWAKVLDKQEHESIGIDDNFFELGGHSLKATTLISKIHKELNVKIPLTEIFMTPTIRGLAEYVKVSARDKYLAIEPLEKKEYYSLSSAQKRLYFLQQLSPDSTGYNMTFVLPAGKKIEKNKIESTLKKLIARHESLRTSFIMREDDPVQRVHSAEDIEFEIEYYDLATESTEYTEDIVQDQKLPIDFFRPFDLSQAPLIRSGLIKTREGNHIWMVDMHHIISDGTSMVILQEDFEALYSGEVLSELNIQYKDFSEWQNRLFESGMIKSQEDYWLNLYRDSGEIPRLDVPVDDRRPKVFTFAGDYYNFVLEREDAAKFKALAAKNNGTLYMNILAVLNTLFYNYTGQSDIIIGTGIAGRPHADLQGVIGMFVNTLAMRNYPQDEKPYESFLQEVIANSVSAFENQDMQFEELVDRLQLERDTSRNPLFDMMMVVQNFRRQNRLLDVLSLSTPEKNLPVIDYTHTTSKFDMTFFVQEEGEDVYISIEYYTAIFKKETIYRFARHFKKIIREVVSNPFIRLAEIDIITEQEREDVLYRFNDTESVYPKDRAVCELFEEQVEQTPDAVAVMGQGAGAQGTVPVPMDHVSITYKELNEKSNQLANFLCYENHIRTEARVGILMDRSVERIMAVLGVLKAGGGYVPIDPSLPEERIRSMIDDAHIEVLISQKRYIRTLNRLQWECEFFHTFLCMDSWDIYSEDEEEKSELMDESLWKYVADTSVDDITAGGWISSYTGKPFSKAEMDEYGDNILKKVTPLLHQKMRVLEIGCASGISMYRIAPRVGFYYGTDLSEVIILKNKKRVEQESHQNIHLSCIPAHDIDKIEEKNFDLIIINSVIQCFPGHNYLRKILHKAIDLMKEQGYIFIGDVMDQELKADFIRDLEAFKLANANKGEGYTTKTDFSSEFFVSRGFFDNLLLEIPRIRSMEYSRKIGTIENELTRFRYDVLVTIDKTQTQRGTVKKYQQDLRALENQGTEKVETRIGPHHMAYVIYTSGTAGQPKGVIIHHGSLVNLCFWHNRYYQVTERDRATQYAGFGFDASVWEIFPYLVKGAAIHIISDDIRLDAGRINDFYESRGITIGFLPTQLCEQFMEESNHSLRVLLTGGDKLNRFTPQSYRLYNNYGPTENTVVTTAGPVEAYNDNIPIGKPIGNVQVYILNKDMLLLQPVGAAGELCIAGASLAGGYLNDPELTAEKFVSVSSRSYRSYRTYSSKKIYKTGDLARWLADGNIEFLGRMDYQVKIRGYRIELGEIESRLIVHDDIKEVVVIDRRSEKGDSYLCAYIVPANTVPGGLDTAQLADFLAEKLPDYMIPTHFVQLGKIPLTLSGKVDRKALLDSVGPAAEEYIAPRNRLEEKLVETWSDVLGINRQSISIDSDFFRMGGHSLNATRLVAKINKEFNLKLPLTKVFEFSRLKDFADYLNRNLSEIEKGGQAAAEMEMVEEKEYYDVSSSQKRIWVLSQQEEASLTFNMPSAYSLEGQLDINALKSVFEVLTARHESLRTVFITINGQPKQKIIPGGTAAFQIHSVDLPGEEPEPSKQMQVQQYIDSEFRTLFDLSIGPLLRVKLLTLARNRYVLLFTMHHIIGDAISMQVLYREVFLLYNSMKKGGGNPLKSLKIQYKDYTAWQNNRLKEEQSEKLRSYWFKQLFTPLPTLQLPTDHPRPQVLTFNGAEFSFTVDEPLTRQLKTIGEQHDATLFMVLLTVFKVLLFRYSGQSDIVVGTVVAGREHADLYDQIGFYLNTLALRTRFNPEDSFTVLLKKVRHVCLEAYDHQLYSFDQLVSQLGIQRDVSRNPIFDVMVDMINTDTDTSVYDRPAAAANANPAEESDLIIQPLGFNEIKSKYDLTVYIFEGISTLSFKFEYNRDLFENTTIRRMAKRLQSLLENIVKNPYSGISDLKVEDVPVFSPIESVSSKVEAEAQLLASYHQERLWFIDQFEAGYLYPSGPVYHNIPLLLEINGALNIELLEQSIKEVIQRHQALRTRVITRDNQPFQSIRPSADFYLEVKDVVQKAGDQLFETAVNLAVEETQRPFLLDQDQEPLIRGLLMQMEAKCKFLLVITAHHIIADRYSLEILAREILFYYESFLGNNSSPQLEDLSFQYGDFSQWQRAFSDDQMEPLLFYWRWKLRGKLQALELPTDRPRAPIHIYQSGWHPFAFAETLNDKINSFIGHNNHLLLLAAFKTLLYHYSGQEEIVVGTGMRNRTQPGTEGIIGPIANLVVVRSFLNQGITFNELLFQLKKTVAEARKYQAMPFDRLVLELKPDVDMSRTALFDVLFQYEENPFQLPEVGNLKINAIETNLGWGKYDLNLLIQRNGDRFSGVLVYNRDYHNESTISRFIGHFMVLLEEILAEPNRQISQFNLLTEEEQRQLLMEWNQPRIDYPTGKTIHEVFQEQAAGRPDAIAVQGQIVGAQGTVPVPMDHVSITYKELNEKSDRLAYVLRQKGVTTDTIVGMLMERSVEMIIAILGILKAGGAYLPIDPDYPRDRIDFILKDSGAKILLTNLSEGHLIHHSSFIIHHSSNLAYIIYTSGTTGQPKGCMITHKNVISLLKNKIQPFDFNENDVWTMFHQYNFDFSVWEMYGSLLYGGKLIVIPKMVTRDPGQYLEILKQEKVTVLNQTPSAFYQLSAAEVSQSNSGMYIRYIIFGGEALNPAKLKQWKAKYPDTKLINMFGITETTIHVTYKEIGDKEIEGGTGNIGRSVSTLTAYVQGRNFNLLPIGVPGELCVGGEGLARGYLNRPELTAEKFIEVPFGRINAFGERGKHEEKKIYLTLYRSGDLVKLLENGDMEYLGRIDHQVQIRGFRIELGEIENQLLAHQAVKEAVVICIEDDRDAGDKTLCACIVSDKGLDAVELRDFLSHRLPGYMVPSLFKQVDHIPLTPNGKVDRKVLRSSGTRLGAGAEYVPPATPTETRIAGIWREILKLDKNEVEIGIHDNFFDIGGTSMDVVRVNARIAEEFEKQIPIVTMYKYTTIRALSGFLDQGETEDHDMYPQEKRVDRIQKGRSDRNKMRDMRKRGRT